MGGQPFDVIIDDAVHDPEEQIQLMNQCSNWLIDGGAYFMEDYCPYKLDTETMLDRITGYRSAVAVASAKPEQLIIAVK